MRFSGKFHCRKSPELDGRTLPLHEDYKGASCHVFEVCGVAYFRSDREKIDSCNVKLIAKECADKESLYGPASLRDKTLIYNCELFRCRIPCPCRLCTKQLNFYSDIDDHLTFHRASHSMCRFCSELENHIPHYSHTVIFKRVYYGAVRPQFERFYDIRGSASMFKHTYNVCSPVKKNSVFCCDKCDKTFKAISQLKRHEEVIHFKKKLKCPQCDVQIYRVDNLKTHLQKVHGSLSEKKFKCEVCNASFRKKSDLERHSSTLRTNCNICSEVFCTLRQLQQHSNDKHLRYECENCNKKFKTKFILERHCQGSINSDGTLKNKCGNCDKKCCSVVELRNHEKVHKINGLDCPYCGKITSSKFRLRTHIGKRENIVCNECGKLCCNSKDLKSHHQKEHFMK